MIDLPYPKIDEENSEKNIAQIKNYLIQLKDALEFALMSITDETKSVSDALAKNIYETNVEREYQITQKVSNGNVVSEINQSAEAIVLSGNRVIIDSDKFKLTKDGNIEMMSGKIKIQGTVTKYASDYTQADADRANSITIGTVSPTVSDFEKLDLNGDGVINALDAILIKRLVDGTDAQREIVTGIEINPLNAHGVLKTEGVFIGANGMYSQNVNTDKLYLKTLYVMNQGGGFNQGVSGSFKTPDGKTVTVINGCITSIT